MIEIHADLWDFDNPAACDALCIATNGDVRKDGCAVMGRGVARDAKSRFPGLDYHLGQLILKFGNVPHILTVSAPAIVSFPVKSHWNESALLGLVGISAYRLTLIADQMGWKVVTLPRPGCGNGNLKWPEVKEQLEHHLDDRFWIINNEGDPS